jgi:rhodanese-related sulfurtransferase
MLKEISTRGLKALMDMNEDFILLNVLDRKVYELEHIPGSINIPFLEVESAAPLFLRKHKTIIVYCIGPMCTASETIAEKLEQMGYTDVIRYTGGMEEWKKAGHRLEGKGHTEKGHTVTA